jgi:hypothetical protein
MTTNKKMTKADYFKQILANYPLTKDEQDFVNHELELLAKKNSSEKKPTAVQVVNDGIKTAILEGMENGRLYTITELIKEIPELAELTNQRVSALVRQLKEEEKIVRVEDKRKAYFRLA